MTSYTINSLVLSLAFLLDSVIVTEYLLHRRAHGRGLSVKEIGFVLGVLCLALGFAWKQAYSIQVAFALNFAILIFPAASSFLLRRAIPRLTFVLLVLASAGFAFCALTLAQGLVRGDL